MLFYCFVLILMATKCLDQTNANFLPISNVVLPTHITDIEFRFDKELAQQYVLGSHVVIRMRCTRLMSVWIHPYFDLETRIVIKGQPLGT